MNLTELIHHPEQMDRDTLYELRSILALYPYCQTARLLLLHNLYLLHDATFDEELRRAAIYITDRKVIFNMIELGHYQLPRPSALCDAETPADNSDRTLSLIDTFLESIPKDEEQPQKGRRKPTPADAAVDYVAYLLESQDDEADEADAQAAPQLRGHSLIDSFIENDRGKIVLNDNPTLHPESATDDSTDSERPENDYATETLARIYIKQGRFSQALEIIKRLSLQEPKKNIYFADQIRFLEKLIINNNHNNH